MIGRLARRLVGALTALLLVTLVGPLADAGSHPAQTQLPEGAAGRLVLPRSRDLWQVAAGGGQEQRLLAGTPLTTVTQASWSPDGRRVAYSLFRFWRADRPPGSDLYTVSADGGDPVPILEAVGEETSFTEPVWTPDGASLVYSAVVRVPGSQLGETTSQVERAPAVGGPRTLLIPDAFSPAVSRDGRQLAFLRASGPSNVGEVSLWLADADGGNPRAVLADRRFTSLAFPRFAPSGDRLAFAAVGGPLPVRRTLGGVRLDLLRGIASAHGEPWDIWEIGADGSGLRRLTELAEDDPSLAWSPDGRWVAMQGGSGVHLIDVSTTGLYRVSESVGFGGIDWTS